MWTLLPLRICSVALVLNKCRGRPQTSVLANRKRRNASTGVIRNQHILSRFVHGYVARIAAAGSDLIQECELATRTIDGECADGSGFLCLIVGNLIHRIKKLPVGMDRHKRWIYSLRRQ